MGTLWVVGLTAWLLAMPLPFRLSNVLIGVVMLLGSIGIGQLAATNIGMEVSISESKRAQVFRVAGQSLMIGVVLGVFLIIAIRLFLAPILPQLLLRFAEDAALPVWKRLIIAVDAAVLEELFFRLFLLSVLVWLLSRVWRTRFGSPDSRQFWIANMLIGVGFGLVHLPGWAARTALTVPITVSVLALNGIGGVTFGYLYYARGIEAAMLAHFAADFVLHVVSPMLPLK